VAVPQHAQATAAQCLQGCQFEIQTNYWQADGMAIALLADLPGRPCPIAAALEVVGERWALLVIREIALGNTRFTGIVAGIGAPRDRIAARLKALEEAGVIARVAYQSAPPRFDYQLTDSGRALLPVLQALLTWGNDYVVAPDDPDRDRHGTRTRSKQTKSSRETEST
jgi:DNA-binding HxlR family transcriptional regulator